MNEGRRARGKIIKRVEQRERKRATKVLEYKASEVR
jgi:hypothetical protein